MDNYDEVLARLERLESLIYNELGGIPERARKNSRESSLGEENLLKYKPSKHRKAYKIERYLKKRCYTR